MGFVKALRNSPNFASVSSLGVAVKPISRFFFTTVCPPTLNVSCNRAKRSIISWLFSPELLRWISSMRNATRIFFSFLPAADRASCKSRNFWIFTTMIRSLPSKAFMNVSLSVASTNIDLSMFMFIIIVSNWSRNCKRSTTIITLS